MPMCVSWSWLNGSSFKGYSKSSDSIPGLEFFPSIEFCLVNNIKNVMYLIFSNFGRNVTAK